MDPSGNLLFSGAAFELGLLPFEAIDPRAGEIYQESSAAEQIATLSLGGAMVINQTNQEPEQIAVLTLDLSALPRTGIIFQETSEVRNIGRLVVQIFGPDQDSEEIVAITPNFGETKVISVDDTSGDTAVEIGNGEKVIVENIGISRCYIDISTETPSATVPQPGNPGGVPVPVGRQLIIDSVYTNGISKKKYIAAICGAGEETTLQVYTAEK